MYKLEKDTYGTYGEFFFGGIDESGDKQLFEAFLYFSYIKEIREKYLEKERKSIIYMPDTCSLPMDNKPKYSKEERIEQKRQWKKQYALVSGRPTGEEILEETIQRAKKIALQYDRFVVLNGQKKIVANYNKEKSKEREQELEERLRRIAKTKIEEGNLRIEDNNITVSKEWMLRYIHYPEHSIPEDSQNYIIRNWTEEVYDILRFLEEAEQSNPKGYYDIWLRTRIKRFETEIERNGNKIKELSEKNCWENKEEIENLEKLIKENEEEIKILKPISEKVRSLRRKEERRDESPMIAEFDKQEGSPCL